jgi:hypothetical protein
LQGERWLTDHYELEERVYRGKAVISGTWAVATLAFEMIEKITQEGSSEILSAQFGRCPCKSLCGELEQEAESVPVGRDGVRARTQLLQQAVGEETLNKGRQAGSVHRSPPA